MSENRHKTDVLSDLKTISIREVSRNIQYGYTASSNKEKIGPKLLRITDIQNNNVNWTLVPYCSISKEEFKRYKLSPGDILFARTGATTGKSFLIRECPPAVFASYLIRIRLNSAVLPEYLIQFFETAEYWNQITTRGNAQPNANAQILGKIRFPLPNLSAQRNIIRTLEQVDGKIGTIQNAIQVAQRQLQIFRRAVLSAACSGKLVEQDPNDEPASVLLERIRAGRKKKWHDELIAKRKDPKEFTYKEPVELDTSALPELPEGWMWTNISQTAEFIGSGITPRGGSKVYSNSGVLFLRSQNVQMLRLHLEDVAYVSKPLNEEMSRTHVRRGDVLLNITGASIGRVAEYDQERKANVNQHVCIIRIIDMVPSYVVICLASRLGQDQIYNLQTGVTREGLNYENVRRLVFPLPPLAEQRRIVARVQELFKFADTIDASVAIAQANAERIKQALLAKAFRGELVEQDPNDEPASVLLRRIKDDRSASVKAKS